MTALETIIEAAVHRKTGILGWGVIGYVTRGGTYVLAADGSVNDNGQAHDLLAILPMDLGVGRILVLRPTVNPDLVDAVHEALRD